MLYALRSKLKRLVSLLWLIIFICIYYRKILWLKDFIKEFEELKLKQKLLIDSLNKKNISQQNQLFLEINSKLDFLVKIFKEANDADNKEEEEKLSSHFKEISDKMDLMQKSILEKIETQEKSISSLKEDILNLIEELFTSLVKNICPSKKITQSPWPRLSHREARKKYGTDKPDLRKNKKNMMGDRKIWEIIMN